MQLANKWTLMFYTLKTVWEFTFKGELGNLPYAAFTYYRKCPTYHC